MGTVSHWIRLPRGAVKNLFLQISKTLMDKTLSNMVQTQCWACFEQAGVQTSQIIPVPWLVLWWETRRRGGRERTKTGGNRSKRVLLGKEWCSFPDCKWNVGSSGCASTVISKHWCNAQGRFQLSTASCCQSSNAAWPETHECKMNQATWPSNKLRSLTCKFSLAFLLLPHFPPSYLNG